MLWWALKSSAQKRSNRLLSPRNRAFIELWFTSGERTRRIDSGVVAAMEELRDLKVVALKRKYLELFGEESRSSNRQFLFRRLAWYMLMPKEI